jgi:hypothetical protein
LATAAILAAFDAMVVISLYSVVVCFSVFSLTEEVKVTNNENSKFDVESGRRHQKTLAIMV